MNTRKKLFLVIGMALVAGALWLNGVTKRSTRQSAAGLDAPSGWEPRMKIEEAAPDKELGLPEEALVRRKVFNLLKNARYDELQSFLSGLQSEMEHDISKEDRLVDTFEGFEIPDPAAGSLFSEWVNKYPDQWPALAARGVYFTNLGFEARGSKWIHKTTQKQIDGMIVFFELAKADLEKAVKLKPQCVPALRRLIAIESALGDAPKAVASYSGNYPESYRLRAQGVHFLRPRWGGSYEQMAVYIEESLRYASANPRLRNLEGFDLYDKADMLFRNKNNEEALTLVQEAISKSGNWQYPLLRGRILLAMNNGAQALSAFDDAVKGRLNGETLAWRAMALVGEERFDEALADVEKARQIDPFDDYIVSAGAKGGKALIQKGRAAMETGDFSNAEIYLKKASGFDPRVAKAHFYLAHVLIKQTRLADAEQAARRAVALAPREFEYTLLLDWILAQRLDWKGIVAAWTEFLRLEPRHGKAYMERAGARRRNLEQDEAIADLKKACELGVAEACALVR